MNTRQVKLVKQATQSYYHEHQWLLIMLKSQWDKRGTHGYYRESLRLNEYITMDLNYQSKAPGRVYIVVMVVSPDDRRAYESYEFTPTDTLDTITPIVHEKLERSYNQLVSFTRGIPRSSSLV
jgi:hypothetical protein